MRDRVYQVLLIRILCTRIFLPAIETVFYLLFQLVFTSFVFPRSFFHTPILLLTTSHNSFFYDLYLLFPLCHSFVLFFSSMSVWKQLQLTLDTYSIVHNSCPCFTYKNLPLCMFRDGISYILFRIQTSAVSTFTVSLDKWNPIQGQRELFSEMWWRIIRQKFIHVFEEYIASNFRSAPLRLPPCRKFFDPERGCDSFLPKRR